MTDAITSGKSIKARLKRARKLRVRLRGRRGSAVIETLMVMSVLLMLSFGAAEYGYFFFVKDMMESAAREGARAAVPSTATNSDVTAAVASVMSAAHISASNYGLATSPTTITSAASGAPITVTVTCTWGKVGVTPLPVAMGGIAATKSFTGVAVMRRE